jgi:iron(III) transport system permease protein
MKARVDQSADRSSTSIIILAGCAMVCLLGVPLLLVLIAAFRGPTEFLPFESGTYWTVENFKYVFRDTSLYLKVIPDTLTFAAGSVTLAYCLGFLFAWVFTRLEFRAKGLLAILVLLPLVLPTPMLALSWMKLFGPNAGWINVGIRAFLDVEDGQGPFNVFSMGGLIWCQGMTSVPFALLLLRPAVVAIDQFGEEAGYMSGANPLRTFFQLTLPRLLPSLAAPLLLMLLITSELVEYPYIIGTAAQVNVLGTRLLWEMNNPGGLPNIGATAVIAILILGFSMACLWLYRRSVRHANRFHANGANVRPIPTHRYGWLSRIGIALVWMYCLLAVCLPLLMLLATSFGALAPESLFTLSAWSAAAYREIFNDGRFWIAARNTFLVASLSGIAVTTVGLLVAMATTHRTSSAAKSLDYLSIASIGLPSIVVAFAVAVACLAFPIGLYGTVWILVLACSYRIALSTRIVQASFARMHPSLIEAAHVSGAGWLKARLSISVPMATHAILYSLVLMTIAGAREFAIPLMLNSPENNVLSIMMMQLYQSGRGAEAAVIAVMLAGAFIVLLSSILFLGKPRILKLVT